MSSSSRYPVVGDLVLLASSGGGELGKKVQTVAVVTQADVASKRFGMCDVVLPLLSRSRTVVLPVRTDCPQSAADLASAKPAGI